MQIAEKFARLVREDAITKMMRQRRETWVFPDNRIINLMAQEARNLAAEKNEIPGVSAPGI